MTRPADGVHPARSNRRRRDVCALVSKKRWTASGGSANDQASPRASHGAALTSSPPADDGMDGPEQLAPVTADARADDASG